jgi:hypothetical protein
MRGALDDVLEGDHGGVSHAASPNRGEDLANRLARQGPRRD